MAVVKLNDFMAANRGRSFEDVVTELEARIQFLEQYIEWDKQLRTHSPALQDAWEKYQIVLRAIS